MNYRQKGYHSLPEVRERRKRYRDENPELTMLQGAKNRASKFGVNFNLTIEDIVIPKYCPILGFKLERFNEKTAPSLDRVNNELGYVKGNVRVISKRANSLKGDMSIGDIKNLLAYANGEL